MLNKDSKEGTGRIIDGQTLGYRKLDYGLRKELENYLRADMDLVVQRLK